MFATSYLSPHKRSCIRASMHQGFTLVELLVTLSVLAIIASIALPNMRAFVVANRLNSNVNEFVGLLNYARSEAIARNSIVIVCSQASNGSCSTDQYWAERPIIVCVDTNGNGTCDTNEPTIKALNAQDPTANEFRLTRNSSSPTDITFLPAGYTRNPMSFNINVVTKDVDYENRYGRLICISKPGRVRVAAFDTAKCE
jgi:type IV fimbrial biogenesis protein FimT